jgi:hypothetical protein
MNQNQQMVVENASPAKRSPNVGVKAVKTAGRAHVAGNS